MVIYRSARNKIAHKEMWDPNMDLQTKRDQHDDALECVDTVTGTDPYIYIRRQDLLRSGFEKVINYLYS